MSFMAQGVESRVRELEKLGERSPLTNGRPLVEVSKKERNVP